MRHLEEQIQKACIKWFDLKYSKYKLLMHSSPNGGKRNAIEAAKFKQMGTRAGFPDLIFLKSNNKFNFLAIELKTKQAGSRRIRKPIRKSLKALVPSMLSSVRLTSL